MPILKQKRGDNSNQKWIKGKKKKWYLNSYIKIKKTTLTTKHQSDMSKASLCPNII